MIVLTKICFRCEHQRSNFTMNPLSVGLSFPAISRLLFNTTTVAEHSGREVPYRLPAGNVLQSRQMPNRERDGDKEARKLLRKHRLHDGLYARVARNLGMTPSHISRVASGKRTSERIMAAIVAELRRIERG
jgi:hypothetical protein